MMLELSKVAEWFQKNKSQIQNTQNKLNCTLNRFSGVSIFSRGKLSKLDFKKSSISCKNQQIFNAKINRKMFLRCSNLCIYIYISNYSINFKFSHVVMSIYAHSTKHYAPFPRKKRTDYL